MQPSEIDKFPFYEYEWILEEIKILQKEQEKQQEQNDKGLGPLSGMNPSKMMNNMTSGMKMPNMSSMSMPKMSIPKF